MRAAWLLLLVLLPAPAWGAYEGFIVPNSASAAFPAQARAFSEDLQIIADGARGNGIVYAAGACAVTAQGSPNMTVAVASCTIVSQVATASVTSGNVTITAANATNPRIDIVSASNAGTKVATAGTPAANPLPPTIPQSGGVNNIVLAFVYVPANDTAINTNQITDKRVFVNTPSVASGAPVGAGYWVKTADGTLTAEQNMSALATGLVQNTVTTGVPTTIAPTDDNVVIGNGTTWQLKALPSCSGSTDALAYTTATNVVSCNTIATAGTGSSYLTKVAEAGLSNEFALGSLATGLLVNTVTTGVPTVLVPTDDNVTVGNGTAWQLKALPTCSAADSALTYSISTNAFGCNTIAGGGSGTVTHTGGALTASRIVLGAGSDDVTILGSLGTTTTVLHGNAAGAPSFGAVSLTADVSGTLPVGNGGTGAATFTSNGVLYGNATGAVQVTAQGATNSIFAANGGAPFFSTTPQSGLWRSVGQFGFVLEPWGTSAGNTGAILFRELAANGTDFATIQAPDAMATPYALVLPNALPGSTQALTVTTGGVMGYQTIAGGGDASTNTATSVDGEMALFSGTTGKLLKRGAIPSDIVAVVTSDVTRTNSVTLIDATGLVLPISSSATEIWQIELQLLVSSVTAPTNNGQDVKLGWTFPTAATMNWGPHANNGTGYFDPPILTGAQTALLIQTSTASYGLTGGVLGGMYFRGWVFGGGTAGNIQLRFAQNIAAASSSVTIKKGSVLFARKLVN